MKSPGVLQNTVFKPFTRACIAVILLCLEPSELGKSLSPHQPALFEGLMISFISYALPKMGRCFSCSDKLTWQSFWNEEKATYQQSFRKLLTSFWKALCSLQNVFTYNISFNVDSITLEYFSFYGCKNWGLEKGSAFPKVPPDVNYGLGFMASGPKSGAKLAMFFNRGYVL